MSMFFYDSFLAKLMEYANPRMKELKVRLWIVEDREPDQMYEIIRNHMQP